MRKWANLHNVVHLCIPPYAASLSRWERSHREVTKALRSCACDPQFYGGRPWYEILPEVISKLNELPFSDDCWLNPKMLVYGFYNPNSYYGDNVSLDHLCDRLCSTQSIDSIKKIRADSQSNHKLRLVDYLRHWSAYREASRSRVLTSHGRPCDLVKGDLCYHLIDNPKTKLASRVLGPYKVESFEPGKSTATIMGFDGSTTRAWVVNLVRVPSNDIFKSDPEQVPSPGMNVSTPSPTNDGVPLIAPDLSTTPADDGIPRSDPRTVSSTTRIITDPITETTAARYLNRLPYEWDLKDLPPLMVLPPPMQLPR